MKCEEELIACIQDASLLPLAREAREIGIIPQEIKDHWKALSKSNVPHPLMCRYLMVHVYREMDSLDSFERWLRLLSKHGVDGRVIHKMRQYDVIDEVEGKEGYASEGEDWVESEEVDLEEPERVGAFVGESRVGVAESKENNSAMPKPLKRPSSKKSSLKTKRFKGSVKSQSEAFIDKIKIVSQTPDKELKDKEAVLFEVRMHVSGCADVSLEYQWYKCEEKVVSEKGCMLCIPCVDITAEGSYTCKISAYYGKKTNEIFVRSEPIKLSVITPLDQYRSILINKYTEQPKIPEDTWPPVSHSTFINLALIKQEGINKGSSSYSRCTIQGDADDIMKDKESIRYEEVFSHLSSGARLLIEGRPGSGKTTLVHKVSHDWAKGKLKFNHCRLLLLIHLRGFLNDPEVDLERIIKCYYHHKAVVDDIVTYVHRRSGLGLYLILDGLDEYIPRKDKTFIFDLIKKEILPKSVVIVASRPAGVARFRYIATKQVEVLGFLNDQISEYIDGYTFSVESKSEDLHKYLDEHPNVHHMCYLPIHAAMVCYLFDYLDVDLPQTETEIYDQFTRHTLLRSISRHSGNLLCLDSIESLPEQEKEVFNKINTLAYEKTVSGKQSVLQSDVDHLFNSAESNDFFGLITVDIKAIGCVFQKMYTFLHLTFQEFLAAYHISHLKSDEQQDLITLHGESKHMLQVWKFYCGLVQFDEICNQFKTLFDSMNCDTLFSVQCSFESQQQHTCDSIIESNSLSFKDKFLTPSDFTAISYVIFNTVQHIVHKLVFDSCTLSREGIDTLSEKVGEKLSLITTLCFHGHNCTCEQLRLVNILVHKLPLLEILDITDTDLGKQEILALTDNDNMNHSNLQILKVGSISNTLYHYSRTPELLVKCFQSSCSNFTNICFNESVDDHHVYILYGVLKMLPYYFYCVKNLPDIIMISCPMQSLESYQLILKSMVFVLDLALLIAILIMI